MACQNGHHDFVNMLIEYEPNLNLDIEAEVSGSMVGKVHQMKALCLCLNVVGFLDTTDAGM